MTINGEHILEYPLTGLLHGFVAIDHGALEISRKAYFAAGNEIFYRVFSILWHD